jgi:hypothetical protein
MFKSRVGDIVIGLCPCPPNPACPATGIVATGNMMDLSGGSPVSRVGDIVVFPCGISIITSGSIKYLSGGLPTAMLSSIVSGTGNGIISTGNPMDQIS